MPVNGLKIFLSSVQKELAEERRTLKDYILNDLKDKGILIQVGRRGPGVHYVIPKKRDTMRTMGT